VKPSNLLLFQNPMGYQISMSKSGDHFYIRYEL